MSDQNNVNGLQEQQPRTFNPNEHIVLLKSKDGLRDYLPVQWRLVWFRDQCPHGVIETEMLHLDLDRETEEEVEVWNDEANHNEKVIKRAKGFVVFRAVVKDGKGGVGTGTKSEKAASFPDYIEKAETGAIGRALAALGFGTQFAPELDEQHRIVDSPVARKVPIPPSGGDGRKSIVSERSTMIGSNAKSSGIGQGMTVAENEPNALMTEQQLASIRKLSERLGKAEPENAASMSYASARELIQQLSQEYNEQRQKGKAS